jgi:hypothetical protein
VPALLQLNVIVIRHAVKAVDAEPFVEQELRKVETDEAGGAGDEDFSHGRVQFDKFCFARETFLILWLTQRTSKVAQIDTVFVFFK